MSLSRRALLGVVAGLPFALKAIAEPKASPQWAPLEDTEYRDGLMAARLPRYWIVNAKDVTDARDMAAGLETALNRWWADRFVRERTGGPSDDLSLTYQGVPIPFGDL